MGKKIGFGVSEEDYEMYKEIKTAVLREYNKLRGVLGHEVIRLATTHPEFIEKKEKILAPKIREKTKNNLLEIFSKLPPKTSFVEKVLDRIIEKTAGLSEPTKRNYKNLMLGHGLIFNSMHGEGTTKYERGTLPDWLKGK